VTAAGGTGLFIGYRKGPLSTIAEHTAPTTTSGPLSAFPSDSSQFDEGGGPGLRTFTGGTVRSEGRGGEGGLQLRTLTNQTDRTLDTVEELFSRPPVLLSSPNVPASRRREKWAGSMEDSASSTYDADAAALAALATSLANLTRNIRSMDAGAA
jgi:hypothetical protein